MHTRTHIHAHTHAHTYTGSFRAVQLHCQCQNECCEKHSQKLFPNRIEFLANGNPTHRQYLPEALTSDIFISTDHVFFEKKKLDLLRVECLYKITMMKGEGQVSRYFNSIQVSSCIPPCIVVYWMHCYESIAYIIIVTTAVHS